MNGWAEIVLKIESNVYNIFWNFDKNEFRPVYMLNKKLYNWKWDKALKLSIGVNYIIDGCKKWICSDEFIIQSNYKFVKAFLSRNTRQVLKSKYTGTDSGQFDR